jgi:hypothetical protein
MARRLSFVIPPVAPKFSLFPLLPTEIREQIWEGYVRIPGMHFLKLDSEAPRNTGNRGPDLDEEPEGENVEDDEVSMALASGPTPLQKIYPAKLAPIYPIPKADLSFYVTLNKLLTQLSVSCVDADGVVQRLVHRPSALKLDTGRIVSLDLSMDVVCLQYLPDSMFTSGCRMPMDIECENLNNIRNLAVRYCHSWESKAISTRCQTCNLYHDRQTPKVYPTHLYEFLARYLPNLETFYFVDYLILRKAKENEEDEDGTEGEACELPAKAPRQTREAKSRMGSRLRSFQSGGRTYYEVDSEEWDIKSDVQDVLSWVKEKFVDYANTNKNCKQTNPEGVKFKVLACEWAPVTVTVPPSTPTPVLKKGHNKRTIGADELSSKSTRVRSPRRKPLKCVPTLPARVGSNLASTVFRFGNPDTNHFEFTFRMSWRK